jgi:hypothetical protein
MFKDMTVSNTIMEEFKDHVLTSGVRKSKYIILLMEVIVLDEYIKFYYVFAGHVSCQK